MDSSKGIFFRIFKSPGEKELRVVLWILSLAAIALLSFGSYCVYMSLKGAAQEHIELMNTAAFTHKIQYSGTCVLAHIALLGGTLGISWGVFFAAEAATIGMLIRQKGEGSIKYIKKWYFYKLFFMVIFILLLAICIFDRVIF